MPGLEFDLLVTAGRCHRLEHESGYLRWDWLSMQSCAGRNCYRTVLNMLCRHLNKMRGHVVLHNMCYAVCCLWDSCGVQGTSVYISIYVRIGALLEKRAETIW